ncbi:aldolase, partial [Acidithiobacillus sp. GGI-221]
GVGYTIYPGSEFEPTMLSEAARIIQDAHAMGLLAVIWAYPRGKAVGEREQDPHLIAGAAGLAACLGADFVKINPPLDAAGAMDGTLLGEAVAAAGRTQVICAGGPKPMRRSFCNASTNRFMWVARKAAPPAGMSISAVSPTRSTSARPSMPLSSTIRASTKRSSCCIPTHDETTSTAQQNRLYHRPGVRCTENTGADDPRRNERGPPESRSRHAG